MTSNQLLSRVVTMLREHGLNASAGTSSESCPHRLVVTEVEGAQEGLVRGLALSVDPDASRVASIGDLR